MAAVIPINYTDYCDVPRVFVASYRGTIFFFDAGYDEITGEYPGRTEGDAILYAQMRTFSCRMGELKESENFISS